MKPSDIILAIIGMILLTAITMIVLAGLGLASLAIIRTILKLFMLTTN